MVEIQNVNFTKIAVAVFFLLMISLSSIGHAAESPPVHVSVEGTPLTMSVPPIIVADRTLVGVRFVGEAVGGKVEWDQEKRQATVLRGSDSVMLTIGNEEALVNGQPVVMEVPAQLVNDRTMVPLRFIAEALGAEVEWDPQTRTANILRKPVDVTGFTYASGTDTARVQLTLSEQPLSVEPHTEGNKVVLEIYPARVAVDQASRTVYDTLMKGMRLSAAGRTVRLEVELWNSPSYSYTQSEDGRQITLAFTHTVTGIRHYQDGRVPVVNIAATGKLTYTVTELQNPARLVLDLPGSLLDPVLPETVAVNQPYLTQVRAAPREAGGARLVLDLPSRQPYDIISTDAGLQVRFVPRIQSAKTERLQGRTRLTLSGNLPLDARVTASPGDKQLLIEVPQGRADLREPAVKAADGSVNAVTFAQGATGGSLLVTVDLPYYLGHTVVSKDGDSSIIVDLVSSPVYGKRIWIDAGHGKIPGGADDPGSIGRTYRTYEKAVNLSVALELQRQLQAAGAAVFMTRTGDEGIDFRDRPAVVNSTRPAIDLFISIHHNSATFPTTRGIETYYWTTNPRSRALAEKLHPAVVKALGFPDRGIRTETFYVIKETRAPSVLVELGFLSNPDEEKAIVEPGSTRKTYPVRAAQGILNGIFEYCWQEIRTGPANY
jgi:N-acetylmuramoyl-L-alanine amidase